MVEGLGSTSGTPMVERETITMIVDTLPMFYHEKLVGYMPSSFVDLVFAGERIEVGLKRGKFDYVTPVSTSNRRFRVSGAKKKEGETHAVTLAPTWPKPQQTPHNTYQYAQHQPSFSACIENPSSPAPVQQRAPVQTQRASTQNLVPTQPRPAGSSNSSISTNPRRNFLVKKLAEFAPIPMPYADLLPSLITNQVTVVTPEKIFQSPFPRWYNPNVTCAYHGGVPGHSIEQCVAFKHKVQSLIDASWLTFQEDGPNIKTNPLASYGGPAINAVEEC